MGCTQSHVVVSDHCPLDVHSDAGLASDSSAHAALREAYLNCKSVSEIRKAVLKLPLPHGIPHHARFWLYQHLSGGTLLDVAARHRLSHSFAGSTTSFDSLYHSLLARGRPPADVERTICNDVYRTLPQYSFFGPRARPGPGQSQLYRVLIAYAHLDWGLGYTQGMNFLAALLLLAGLPEEGAFYTFTGLMVGHGLRALFAPGLPAAFAVQAGVEAHLRATHAPLAQAIFDRHSISPGMFVPTWLLSMFLSSPLPPSSALSILDLFLLESPQPVLWKAEAHKHRGYSQDGCVAGCKDYPVLHTAPMAIGASWPCCLAPVVEALATATPIPALPMPMPMPMPGPPPAGGSRTSAARPWAQYLAQGRGKVHVFIRACAALVIVHKAAILPPPARARAKGMASSGERAATPAARLDSEAIYAVLKNSEGELAQPSIPGEREDRSGEAALSQWDLEVAAGLHDGVSGLVHAAVQAKGAKQDSAPAIIGHGGNHMHPHPPTTSNHHTHAQEGAGGGPNGPQTGSVSALSHGHGHGHGHGQGHGHGHRGVGWKARPPSAPLVRGTTTRHSQPTPVHAQSMSPESLLSPSMSDATGTAGHGSSMLMSVVDTLSPAEQEGPPQYSLLPERGMHEWGAAVLTLHVPPARLECVPESPSTPAPSLDSTASPLCHNPPAHEGQGQGQPPVARKLLPIGQVRPSVAAVHPAPVSSSAHAPGHGKGDGGGGGGRVCDGTGVHFFPARPKWVLHAGHAKAMRVHVHGRMRGSEEEEEGEDEQRLIVWTCDGRVVPAWACPKPFLHLLG